MPSTASAIPLVFDAAVPPPPPADNWALFIDFDGTLCSYRDIPADVVLTPAQEALLQQLWQRLDGAVCVLSGRSGAELKRIFSGVSLKLVGDHGATRGTAHDEVFLAELDKADAALRELAAAQPGTWVERKPASCALHYRQVPDRAVCLRAAMETWPMRWSRLRLLDGHDVFEWTSAAQSKGTALATLMQQPPFHGRIPVAVGDDVTDEDAFAVARTLGGFGVAVGPRHSHSATFALSDAVAVNQWLAATAGADAAAQATPPWPALRRRP